MYTTLKRWLGRKWSAPVLVGLQAPDCRHLALGLASHGRPHAKWVCLGRWGQTRTHDCRSKWAGLQTRSGRLGLESCVRTQCYWVRRQDPLLMSFALGSISLGSCIKTQVFWVLRRDPILLCPLLGPKVLESINLSYIYHYFSYNSKYSPQK